MKYCYLIAILLNFTAISAQINSDSVLISEDGKFLLMIDDPFYADLDYQQIVIRNFDSLYVGTTYILRADTIFTKTPSYAGQYGYYYYVGDEKTYNIIYDTILFNEFNMLYNFDKNNWIHRTDVQLIVDTLKTILEVPRNSSNYYVHPHDTIDLSRSYELLIKFVYNNTILYSVKKSEDLPSIFNSFDVWSEGLYLDLKHQKYFLESYLVMKNYMINHDTYEVSTIMVGYEILESGLITW